MTAAPTPAGKGVFVSVDGPGGVGKSTVVAAIVAKLAGAQMPVHPTREPSDTPLGKLARHGTEEYHGLVMAHLIGADRYQHLKDEIRPALARGHIVVCDRYIAASLVLQRMDGVDRDTIWQINQHADRPDLAVVLTAHPDVIADRLARRGAHSRYERMKCSSHIEHGLYGEAAEFLTEAGVRVLTLDATATAPEDLAGAVVREILAIRATATS